MARGFLGGVVTGGVVVLGVGAATSLLAPLPRPPEVAVTAGDAMPVQEAPTAAPSRPGGDDATAPRAADAQPERRVTTYTVPVTTEPEGDSIAGLDDAATAPAAPPVTGDAETLGAPGVAPESNDAAPTADEPVLPNPMALAPMEPQEADELSISTEPAQPPAPPAEEPQTAFAAEDDSIAAPIQPDIAQVSDGVEEAPAAPPSGSFGDPAQPTAVEAPESTGTLPVAEDGERALALAEDAPTVPLIVQRDDLPAAQPDPVARPEAPEATEEAEEAEAPEQTAGETADVAPEPAPEIALVAPEVTAPETPPATGPQIGRPATSLVEREESEAAPDAVPAETETAPSEAGADPRPITRYAVDFEPEPDKPLMSIVLIDDGQSLTGGEAGLAALRSFPYPVTFAVDATLEDAGERMRAFRDEGFEVLAMVDLPEGADARDAETTFATALARVPEAVGVLEGTEGGFQGSRETSDQVSQILADTGLGLVTQDRGLNTMPKLARKQGVPAYPIFRDFDSKDQTPTVIRRFLDGAAFKARQEGGVIMLGRLRPDTISALLLWGLQDRASKVSLAPVSAVLLQEP
ncbi:MAG: hypothetical protein CML61_09235 [Rhodobacteraceae bacterium]|nr:hypothetical protein [Paracoccaceae bacterium]